MLATITQALDQRFLFTGICVGERPILIICSVLGPMRHQVIGHCTTTRSRLTYVITMQNQKDAYWRKVNASWRRMNASGRKMSI